MQNDRTVASYLNESPEYPQPASTLARSSRSGTGFFGLNKRDYINGYHLDPITSLPPPPPPLHNPPPSPRQRRVLRKFFPFKATWLTGISGETEAKAKPLSPVSSTPSLLLNDARVYAAATSFLTSRKSRTNVFAFEDCAGVQTSHRSQIASNREPNAAIPLTPLPTTAENHANLPFDAVTYTNLDQDQLTCRRYNLALATRLRNLADGDLLLAKLKDVRCESGFLGNAADAKSRAEQHRFRHESYTKAAKLVEDYPIPLSCDSLEAVLEHPNHDVDADSYKHQRAPSPKRRKQSLAEPPKCPRAAADSSSLPLLPDSMSQELLFENGSQVTSTSSVPWTSSHHPPKIRVGGSILRRLTVSILEIHKRFYPSSKTGGFDWSVVHRGDPDFEEDQRMLSNPELKSMMQLRRIWGVGPKAAATLVSWGVYSIEALRSDKVVRECLNRCQKIGLKHYEDINTKIPRDEVASILRHVQYVTDDVCGGPGIVLCTACGSFRRGASSSGDIDIILLPASTEPRHDKRALDVYDRVRRRLTQTGFIVDTLTWPNLFKENEGLNPPTESKGFMGLCKLPSDSASYSGIARRLDLKAYPRCQGAFATLYFTGSAHFNRSMREFCKKSGLTLSDAGLALTYRDEGGHKAKTLASIRADTEEDVFEALGIEYVGVTYRDVGCGVGWQATGGGERGGFWDEDIGEGLDEMDEGDYREGTDEAILK